jgi:hypothetical protein
MNEGDFCMDNIPFSNDPAWREVEGVDRLRERRGRWEEVTDVVFLRSGGD